MVVAKAVYWVFVKVVLLDVKMVGGWVEWRVYLSVEKLASKLVV